LGFKGVEFAQVPSKLGHPERLPRLLEERGLTLLGLAGGTLRSRVAFCAKSGLRPLYLYIENWDEPPARAAIAAGHTLALHPHFCTPIDSFARARPLFAARPASELQFLPDTAHLYLASDPFFQDLLPAPSSRVTPEKATERAVMAEVFAQRVKAVHFKDWTPQYGYSVFTYARGFTELGCGIIPLRKIQEWLTAHFGGWLVIEQDWTERLPRESLRMSLDWLAGRSHSRLGARLTRLPAIEGRVALAGGAEIASFLDTASRASIQGTHALYETALAAFAQLLPCRCAALWEVSARNNSLALQAFWDVAGTAPPLRNTLTHVDESLAGLALQERTIQFFGDLTREIEGRTFQDPAFAAAFGVRSMLAVPVSNLYNMNQSEVLITLYPATAAYVPDEALYQTLSTLSRFLATFVNLAWNNARKSALDDVNWRAARARTLDALLHEMLEPVLFHLGCRECDLYSLGNSRTTMELGATTLAQPGSDSRLPAGFPSGQGLPRLVWRNRTAFNSRTDPPPEGEPLAVEQLKAEDTSHLLMPVYRLTVPNTEVIGVIWARGKVGAAPGAPAQFAVSDELVLDAIQSALSSHLDRIATAERRSIATSRIRHELREPINVTIGATALMKRELARKNITFDYDYLGDIEGYMELMGALIAKSSFLRLATGLVLNRSRAVLLLRDVVAPTVRQLRVKLRERRFSADHVNFSSLMNIPPLYIDKTRFQQVVFNLLGNAIKFSFDDPETFFIEILGEETHEGFVLKFRDYGRGIDPGMEEAIFLEGVRGPSAYQQNIEGDGIGLWLVREIVNAHGGKVFVSIRRAPTEITIVLPASVEYPPATGRHTPSQHE
jgi:signal transduction histidine kinase/sugar phosphate isomerase/epimerase